MSRTATYFAATALALSACTASEGGGDPSDQDGAGGKADDADARTCGTDRTCLQFSAYEVLFTNPICETYGYDEPMETVGGGVVAAKPKNAYCTKEFDSANSGGRDSSPQTRILEWIDDTSAGDEIFLAYLSFSDPKVADALCSALDRDVDVTFVLDKKGSKAEQVEACGGEILVRGHQGSVGFAHNKILMINPRAAGPADDGDEKHVRISFGSGNMSSGTHLHHENWHFIHAVRESFFIESHLCLIDALIPREHTDGKGAFRSFMNECREQITFPPEDDMIPYFIPVRDDSKALVAKLLENIEQAETIDVGAHRFSFTAMMEALKARLADPNRPFHLRLVADDDLYWLDPMAPSVAAEIGPNTPNEAVKVRELRAADDSRGRFEERYLETNHSLHLLHHNKYLVFEGVDSGRDALLFGSSNLTGTGFEGNLENMYFTDIPEVVDAFKNQFGLFWDGEGQLPEGLAVAPMATPRDEMPVELVTLTEPTMGVDPDPDPDPDPAECGVRIAEVFYDAAGSDAGREWVKLYNSCDDAAALEGMSLGWGGNNYVTGSADLSGMLEGGRCMIVGAPISDERNGEPMVDVEIEFSPALQNAGNVADGVALFADKSFAVEADTTPVDAVIYGGVNDSGLLDARGERPEAHVGDARAGDSIQRTGAERWEIGAPTPDSCPDF